MLFVRTVRITEHHEVVCSRIFTDEFPDMYPREWTKLSVITLEEAKEAYMWEVIAESHC